jgi:hypothetical protein
VFSENHQEREPSMSEITTIGLDLAKHVFQVHGIDAEGTTVLRRRLRRNQVLAFFSRVPRCVVGLEACATAHYWARELAALGHEVRLMPAQYVKAYIKRNKNDAADAEAICEAVQRPTMRFVPVKTAEQQASGQRRCSFTKARATRKCHRDGPLPAMTCQKGYAFWPGRCREGWPRLLRARSCASPSDCDGGASRHAAICSSRGDSNALARAISASMSRIVLRIASTSVNRPSGFTFFFRSVFGAPSSSHAPLVWVTAHRWWSASYDHAP